jgi:hypothetical protein
MDDNQLQEINIDTIKHLSWVDKGQVLLVRREWLKRQRTQDKKDLRKQEGRKHKFKWTKQGLCPNCKEHDIIYKSDYCMKCYGKILKKGRKKRKEKRLLNAHKKTKHL